MPPSFPGEPELESLEISGTVFLCSICPSCQPTDSVRELKRTQNTDLSLWPCLILFIHHHTLDGRGDRCYTIILTPIPATAACCQVFMATLWNRAGHYIFILWFLSFCLSIYLSFIFFSSPNLSRRRLHVCHTSTHGVALVQI